MSEKKVTIIDYNLGNLYSVKQACDVLGIDATISANIADVERADALILPGVGAFIEAMNNLNELQLVQPILAASMQKKPIFGICLGLQLLFSASEEFGSGEGLGLISGMVKKFPSESKDKKVKVPQIGWNTVYKAIQGWDNSPLREIEQKDFMYFVHSYYVQPFDEQVVLTKTNYEGIEYCSSILYKNIFATQFHPEKSADKGLSIYKNWALINNLL